jgi:teichuronic acid biosynthesis glycosyltransferase TuaC
MKILFITNMFPTAEDPGFGCFVKSQIDSLAEKDIRYDLIFADGRSSKLNYLLGAWRVFRRSLNDSYDLVHAHYGLSGLLARCQWRAPIVVSFCGSDVLDRFQGKISRLVSRMADCSIVKSPNLKAALKGKNVYILPNGVDLNLFRPMDHEQAKCSLGLSPERSHILFVGGADRKVKRIDVARKVTRIVGARLRRPVELIELHARPQMEVAVYMNAADVLLMTSDWEGSPNAVKEAMACNLPVVSTDVGDVREMIGGLEHCHICPQDPAALAEKVLSVLSAPVRTSGRESVGRYGLERTADRLVAIYKNLIGEELSR